MSYLREDRNKSNKIFDLLCPSTYLRYSSNLRSNTPHGDKLHETSYCNY